MLSRYLVGLKKMIKVQGVSKNPQDKEMEKVAHNHFYSIKFTGKISMLKKTEVSLVVLHIITFHRSN